MTEAERIVQGFWVWVGDYVIGSEREGKYVAIHKTGDAQIQAKWDEDKLAAAQQLVDRCGQRVNA